MLLLVATTGMGGALEVEAGAHNRRNLSLFSSYLLSVVTKTSERLLVLLPIVRALPRPMCPSGWRAAGC